MRAFLVFGLAIVAAACGGAPEQAPPAATSTSAAVPDTPTQISEKWRAKHETDYRRDWVSIAGLHPLKEGPNTVGGGNKNDIVLSASVPDRIGTFILKGQTVRFEPRDRVDIQLKGQPVTAAVDLKDDSGTGADELTMGDRKSVV